MVTGSRLIGSMTKRVQAAIDMRGGPLTTVFGVNAYHISDTLAVKKLSFLSNQFIESRASLGGATINDYLV